MNSGKQKPAKMKYFLTSVLLIFCININAQITETVATVTNERQFLLPYNRLVQPAGHQIIFGDDSRENHSMDLAISTDGKWLAVEERFSIVFISTNDNNVKFTLLNNMHPDLRAGRNTYSGILWDTDNEIVKVYWSVVGNNNRSFVVSAVWDGDRKSVV